MLTEILIKNQFFFNSKYLLRHNFTRGVIILFFQREKTIKMFKNGSSIIGRQLSRDSVNPITKSLHRMDISGIWPPIPTPFETQSPADK